MDQADDYGSNFKDKKGSIENIQRGYADEKHGRKRAAGSFAVQKIIAQSSGLADSDEDDSEESEMEDYSSDDEVIINKKRLNSKRELTTSESKADEYDRSASDNYFCAQHGRRTVTSDKTLSSLKLSKMDPLTLRQSIESHPPTHQEEIQSLTDKYVNMFDKWMFQLRNGFNCLLYGLGSKVKLLNQFRKLYLSTQDHIVVNGFFPGLSIKQILNMISEDLLNYTGTFKSLVDQAVFIKSEYERDDAKDLFLLVHNIDGVMLRSAKAQDALSMIASASRIRVLASVDHINCALLWDQKTCSRYNWLWKNVTTFEPYVKEMSFENSFLIQQSASLALSSLIHVLRSLTPNAKGIFKLLANHRLDNEEESSYGGLSFSDLYQKCREKFLVSSDLALRAQLTEFKDHKLIKSRKGQDGIEYLTIPMDSSSIRYFLEEDVP